MLIFPIFTNIFICSVSIHDKYIPRSLSFLFSIFHTLLGYPLIKIIFQAVQKFFCFRKSHCFKLSTFWQSPVNFFIFLFICIMKIYSSCHFLSSKLAGSPSHIIFSKHKRILKKLPAVLLFRKQSHVAIVSSNNGIAQ